MGEPVLLLRLEGPLQAWGGRARWDVRETGTEPTKSGVIGLLGCALGIASGSARLEELDKTLRFGVRVEAAGRILEDYQTVTDFLPTAGGEYKASGNQRAKTLSALRADPDARPATILSPRFYLEDAAFLVGLSGGRARLDECAAALQSPRWPLFLGRKACIPTRPIFEDMTEDYDDLGDALRRHPRSWLGFGGEDRTKEMLTGVLTAYVEDTEGTFVRQDALRVNPSRQYDFLTLKKLPEFEETP